MADWRAVPDYEGWYEVSDQGRVRSVERTVRYVDGRVRRYPQRELKLGLSTGGYPQVGLSRDNSTRIFSVHRLVLMAFVGACPPGHEALHANDVRADARLGNLSWNTSSQNDYDMVRRGRHHLASRGQCGFGHDLEDPNIAPNRRSGRHCLACQRARSSQGNARKRGLDCDFQAESDRQYSSIMSGVPLQARRDLKPSCDFGHRLAEPNLRQPGRKCLACHRASAGKAYAKRTGRAFDFRREADRHYRSIMSGPVASRRGPAQSLPRTPVQLGPGSGAHLVRDGAATDGRAR